MLASPRMASRRLALLAVAAILPQLACSRKDTPMNPPTAISPEDAALRHRFRGIRGGELRVDATFLTDSVVILDAETNRQFNIGMGSFGPGGSTVSGYGGNVDGDRLVIPKHLRMRRYAKDARFLSPDKPPYFEGAPIVDVTVPVAERIPEEALDELRTNGGGLRLKLRIHPDTLLVGWDIEHRPGYDPKNTNNPHYPPAYLMTGGDFKEARPAHYWHDGRTFKRLPLSVAMPLSAEDRELLARHDLKAVGGDGMILTNPPTPANHRRIWERGWYIDPKTGQKIETDF
jgi:hypothetical protein